MATSVGLLAQNKRYVTVIDSPEPKQPCNTPDNGGEAAAIAAGALIVMSCDSTTAPTPAPTPAPAAGPTYRFQGTPPPASAPAPCPSPAPQVYCVPPPKRPCWIKRAFQNVGLWFSVSGNIGSTGAYNGGEYWVLNSPAYDAYYYGSDRVFWYGPSIGTSYRFIDNYQALRPMPPTRQIWGPGPLVSVPNQIQGHYPGPRPGLSHQGGGGHRGR